MPKHLRFYVGAYTQNLGWINGQAKGIMLYQLDPLNGEIEKLSEIASDNPSYLATHPSAKFLYAVNETTKFGEPPDNAVSSFAIDPQSGALALVNQQASLGISPCYISVEPTGHYVLIANYMSGNFVVYPLDDDGRLAPASDNVQNHGSGSNPQRQEGPHAHSINLAPGGKFALGCDLGLDTIFIYRLDLKTGKLAPVSQTKVAGGFGPRHLDFHPNGKFVYLINEMGGTMTIFNWDDEAGTLAEIQTISMLPSGYDGQKWCADVHVHPSGKFVYGSNRAHDSIVIYSVEEGTGKLVLIGHEATRGKTPRNFAISPAGDLLLVANQDSNSITVFQIDTDNGQLCHLTTSDVPTPVCVKFT